MSAEFYELFAFTCEDNPNKILVKVITRDDGYMRKEMLIDLPCGLSTKKTYGPEYTTYHCFGLSRSDADYRQETKHKWVGDPEHDHVEEVYVDTEGYVKVILFPGGAKDAVKQGMDWIPKGSPWELDYDNHGKLCLMTKQPITPETPGLEVMAEHLF